MLRVSSDKQLCCGHSTHAHELSCYFVRKFRTYSTCAEPFPRTSLWPSRLSHSKKLSFVVLKWLCAVYKRQVLIISKSTLYGYIFTYFTKAGLKIIIKIIEKLFCVILTRNTVQVWHLKCVSYIMENKNQYFCEICCVHHEGRILSWTSGE